MPASSSSPTTAGRRGISWRTGSVPSGRWPWPDVSLPGGQRRSPTLTPPHGGRSSARLERQVVALEVGGSSPLGHPKGGQLGSSADCASSSMAEQRTLNPQVLGSNPRGRTNGGSARHL